MSKSRILLGVSGLAVATAMAGVSHAQTVIYGGGGSASAPYLRQAWDCFGNRTALVNQGSTLTGPSANDTLKTYNYFNFSGPPPSKARNCATAPVDSATTVKYVSASSGIGIASFFGHDATTFLGDVSGGATPNVFFPSLQFGISDAGLSGADFNIFNNGGTEGSGSSAVVIEAPGVSATPGQTPPQYNNPIAQYGKPIQIPLLIVPVVLTYSSVYSYTVNPDLSVTQYKFNIKKPNKDGSGGLLLDMPTVCAIFNGKITNWNDPALKYLNGGQSLQDPADTSPWSLPIEIVGRSDSAGTTANLYRALAAQCTGSDTDGGDSIAYTNAYLANGSKSLPLSLSGPTYSGGAYTATTGGTGATTPTPGQFTLVKGNGGIASYITIGHGTLPTTPGTYTAGQFAYIGADFTLPASAATGANTYGLNVVDIKVGTKAVEPTPANVLKAFGALLPPQSSATGAYSAGSLGSGRRSAAQDWAQPVSTTQQLSTGVTINTPLANPNVNISGVTGAYPIVGTTDGLFYTCYADAGVAAKLKAFLTWYYSNVVITAKTGLAGVNGFAPLPKAWATAITQTFLTPVSTGAAPTDVLNLNILQAGTGPATGTGSQCAAVTPGA